MSDKLVFSSSGGGKSSIRRWYESIVPGSAHMQRAKHHLTVAGEAVRGGGEGLVVGAVLGAAHASLPTGLDIKLPIGEGRSAHLPADAVLAALALVGSAAMAPNEAVGTDLRNTGIAAAGIFAFRKTADFVALKNAQSGRTTYSSLAAHGDDESYMGAEDPVVAAARNL